MSDKITLTLGAETAEALAKIRQFTDQVKAMFAATAEVAGIALSFDKIKEAFAGVIEAGSDLEIMHERTGIATESLAKLEIAMKDAGVQGGLLSRIMGTLSKNLLTAYEKGGAAAKAISDLGLNIKDLLQLQPDEQFQQIATHIGAVSNATLRGAYAMQLFGRAGTQLLPVFNAMAQAGNDNAFTSVLARNAEIFHELEIGFDRIKRVGQGLFLGILDQISPIILEIVNGLGKIDLTGFGRSIGAFVQVAIDAWKNGEFGEFIGLTIRAGFEEGEEAVQKFLSWSYDAISNALGSADFWTQVWFAFVEAALKATADISKAFLYLAEPFTGLFTYLGRFFETVFSNAIEKVKEYFSSFTTWFKDKWNTAMEVYNKFYGINIPTFSSAGGAYKAKTKGMPSFDQSFTDAAGATMDMGDQVDKYFNDLTEDWRKMLGISEKFGTVSTSARDSLKKFIDSKKAARTGGGEFDFGALDQWQDKMTLPVDQLQNAKNAVETVRHSLVDLDAVAIQVQTDWTATSAEKWEARRKILEAEKDELEALIVVLRKIAATPGLDPKERDQILKMLDNAKTQSNSKSKELGALGADPNSFSQQWASTITKLRDQFGTFAEETAQKFASVFNSSISSISSGITGLIMGTKTWSQALAQIGTQILTSIVNAIVEMGVRWVLTQIMMAVAGKAILASATAATAPIAAAQAAIWATPATLATIASYGGAAVAAPGFIGAAEGVVAAESITGFAEGGMTPGRPTLSWVGERGPEFVVSSHRVTPQTLPVLQAIQSGQVAGGSSPAGRGGSSSTLSGGGSPHTHINLGMFNAPRDAQDWANSKDGQAWFIDMQNKFASRIIKS